MGQLVKNLLSARRGIEENRVTGGINENYEVAAAGCDGVRDVVGDGGRSLSGRGSVVAARQIDGDWAGTQVVSERGREDLPLLREPAGGGRLQRGAVRERVGAGARDGEDHRRRWGFQGSTERG